MIYQAGKRQINQQYQIDDAMIYPEVHLLTSKLVPIVTADSLGGSRVLTVAIAKIKRQLYLLKSLKSNITIGLKALN